MQSAKPKPGELYRSNSLGSSIGKLQGSERDAGEAYVLKETKKTPVSFKKQAKL